MLNNHNFHGNINLSIVTLIAGEVATASILVGLGALSGKLSPVQTVFMVFWGVIFYSLNEALVGSE